LESIIRLIHITDPHLTSLDGLPLSALAGKRWSGYLSWRRRRRFVHRRDVLDALTVAVQAENPFQILVTGDLVHVGLPSEIEAAGRWLRELGPPARVMLVPGNHDIYAEDSWPAASAAWNPYLGIRTAAGAAVDIGFPVVRSFGDAGAAVSLIGISSARPSPLFMAYGRLGADQRARLEAQLDRDDAFRCVLIHHPPLPGMVSWRKGLQDAHALSAVLARHGAELVLHGHVHRNSACIGPGGARIFGTASASSVGTLAGAAYRSFEVTRNAVGWQVTMRLVQVGPDAATSLLAETAWTVPVTSPASAAAGG